jgi:transcriptional/translational regulatory protein YebC/TACO1
MHDGRKGREGLDVVDEGGAAIQAGHGGEWGLQARLAALALEALEQRGLSPLSAEHEYVCMTPIELPEDQAQEVLTLVDKLEQDDDVQRVFHTLA